MNFYKFVVLKFHQLAVFTRKKNMDITIKCCLVLLYSDIKEIWMHSWHIPDCKVFPLDFYFYWKVLKCWRQNISIERCRCLYFWNSRYLLFETQSETKKLTWSSFSVSIQGLESISWGVVTNRCLGPTAGGLPAGPPAATEGCAAPADALYLSPRLLPLWTCNIWS